MSPFAASSNQVLLTIDYFGIILAIYDSISAWVLFNPVAITETLK